MKLHEIKLQMEETFKLKKKPPQILSTLELS
jgi:hypothetical protein